jgi:hypothetical protein
VVGYHLGSLQGSTLQVPFSAFPNQLLPEQKWNQDHVDEHKWLETLGE